MSVLNALALRIPLFLLSFLSFKGLYILSYLLTPILYRLIPKYRKRALSNLSLASELALTETQVKIIAQKSLFHLLLTALEYGKLARVKTIGAFCKCLNPQTTDQLLDHKQGVIFFCGHQSNWELLFLDATSRHPGVCIGKPIKNSALYNFILKIRQKFHGQVITPKEATKGCLKALKQGSLVGIVGDQGLPESSFSYNCLGRRAHMTTLPALLSLRSKAPLFVATIVRGFGSYEISYSEPITGDDANSLMHKALLHLDQAILKHPEQYMWQHNRWKISYAPFIPKKYRHDAIALILPPNIEQADLELIKELYNGAYFIVFKPHALKLSIPFDEIIDYTNPTDCFITHYGPKLMIDCVGLKGLKKHFKRQALFEYLYTPSFNQLISSWRHDHAH